MDMCTECNWNNDVVNDGIVLLSANLCFPHLKCTPPIRLISFKTVPSLLVTTAPEISCQNESPPKSLTCCGNRVMLSAACPPCASSQNVVSNTFAISFDVSPNSPNKTALRNGDLPLFLLPLFSVHPTRQCVDILGDRSPLKSAILHDFGAVQN